MIKNGFDWESYLDLADHLARQDNDAARRSAISRAYYAFFNVANHWYLKNPPSFPKDGTIHAKVLNELKMRGASNIASQGLMLKRQREQADYDPVFKGKLSFAAGQSVRLAREQINKLKALEMI